MLRKSSSITIPEEYLCPISWNLMTDPVILSDGHTYDKSSIKYIKNSLSPITKLPINTKNKIPNRLIKGFIDKFIVENKIKLPKSKKPKATKKKPLTNTNTKLKTKSVKIKKTSIPISPVALAVKPKWRV